MNLIYSENHRAHNLTNQNQTKNMIEKLKEESTWRGIIALATSLGITIQPEMINIIVSLGIGLIGLINVIKKQRK